MTLPKSSPRLFAGARRSWQVFCCSLGGANRTRNLAIHYLSEQRRIVMPSPHRPYPQTWDAQKISATWIGQSSVLINFFGLTILTDPAFSARIGLRTPFGTIGPKRLIAPALPLQDLPSIDLLLISHAHFDHLDLPSLRFFPRSTPVVTARHTSDVIRRARLEKITELSWGQKTVVNTAAGPIAIEAIEVKHWGARWRKDVHRGYNGYVLSRGGQRVLFGGDTAYLDSFRHLRSQGPLSLAVMPIGAYEPWLGSHCNPEQAVQMTNDAGADFLLPVHHQTFVLSREPLAEPMERLLNSIDPARVAWREIGETFTN